MTDDIDGDLSRVNTGIAAGTALQLIQQELDARIEASQNRIFRILNDSSQSLDPQQAVQFCIELHEIHKLRQGLTKKKRVGVTAGSRIGPVMDGGQS